MSNGKIYDESSEVESAAGEVMVSGPDGVAISMTPRAAAETGSKLIEGAANASDKEKSGVIEADDDAAE